MNIVELNFDALVGASMALLGSEKTNILSELYTLLDNVEKRGYNKGYAEGYAQGAADNDVGAAFHAGYEQGCIDGQADAEVLHDEPTYHEGFEDGDPVGFDEGFEAGSTYTEGRIGVDAFEAGFDAGYEKARQDLGECPIVDQDWDCTEDGYLRRAVHDMLD